jgi:hypothetical protein
MPVRRRSGGFGDEIELSPRAGEFARSAFRKINAMPLQRIYSSYVAQLQEDNIRRYR